MCCFLKIYSFDLFFLVFFDNQSCRAAPLESGMTNHDLKMSIIWGIQTSAA